MNNKIRKANNMGLVTTTAGNDFVHLLPTGRSFRITKIMAYNPGADTTLIFGTMNLNPGGTAFVALLPTLLAVGGGVDNEWTEDMIPGVEWQLLPVPTAAGRDGNLMVLAGLANILLSVEVEEKG